MGQNTRLMPPIVEGRHPFIKFPIAGIGQIQLVAAQTLVSRSTNDDRRRAQWARHPNTTYPIINNASVTLQTIRLRKNNAPLLIDIFVIGKGRSYGIRAVFQTVPKTLEEMRTHIVVMLQEKNPLAFAQRYHGVPIFLQRNGFRKPIVANQSLAQRTNHVE